MRRTTRLAEAQGREGREEGGGRREEGGKRQEEEALDRQRQEDRQKRQAGRTGRPRASAWWTSEARFMSSAS